MIFDFELTISGLVIAAVKSRDAHPTKPDAVDLIFPRDEMHQARLSYFPLEVSPTEEADMQINPDGEHIASLLLDGRPPLEINLIDRSRQSREFALRWGPPEAMTPDGRHEEQWLNWVARLEDLGFGPFTISSSEPPINKCVRVTLPPGELIGQSVIRDQDTDHILAWQFPATGNRLEKALVNDLLFRVRGIEGLQLFGGEDALLSSDGPKEGRPVVRMCLSNDTRKVPVGYASGSRTLKHLRHIDHVAPLQRERFPSRDFEPPKVPSDQRTGDPICNGVIFVYDDSAKEGDDGGSSYRTA
jgi:hypothetical protein